MTNANFTGAIIAGASVAGFTSEQLYSTASYEQGNLQGIRFSSYSELNGWDFSNQDLTNASFYNVALTNVNFTGAIVAGANFTGRATYNGGLSKEQLYSTASYQQKQLRGIQLGVSFGHLGPSLDLHGWDLRGQDLSNARFPDNTRGADLSFADLRGAEIYFLGGAITYNTIQGDGTVARLNLDMDDRLLVRDDDGWNLPTSWPLPRDPISVTIQDAMTMSNGGRLQLLFDADPWGSQISFDPGIPVQLGGTLELVFTADVDLATQIGRTLHIFDWTGVFPVGEFSVVSPYGWDTSRLYTAGEITLLAVPEPSDVMVMFLSVIPLLGTRRRNSSVTPQSRVRCHRGRRCSGVS